MRFSQLEPLISRRAVFVVAALLFASLAAWAASAVVPPNLPRATSAQRALVASNPGDAGAQVDLGNLLMLGGQTEEAEAAYLRALDIDPGHAAAHFNLGLLLQGRGEPGRALRAFRRAVDSDPRHAWAHYQIGTIEAARGFEALAVRSYARAFALDPRLRFPDVNPHVIDNPLTTRAMLQAYRLNLSPTAPSPDFDDPVRVASLLLIAAGSEVPEAAESAEETAANPPVERIVGRAGSGVGLDRGTGEGRGAAAGSTSSSASEGTQEPAFTRTIGAGDLNPSSRAGQVVGQGSGSTPGYRPPAPPPIYEPAPQDQNEDEGAPQKDDNPGGGLGPRPRPSVQSTGRLEMKLVPGASADRA